MYVLRHPIGILAPQLTPHGQYFLEGGWCLWLRLAIIVRLTLIDLRGIVKARAADTCPCLPMVHCSMGQSTSPGAGGLQTSVEWRPDICCFSHAQSRYRLRHSGKKCNTLRGITSLGQSRPRTRSQHLLTSAYCHKHFSRIFAALRFLCRLCHRFVLHARCGWPTGRRNAAAK